MNYEVQGKSDKEKRLQLCSLERLRSSGLVSVSDEVPLLGRTVDLVYILDESVVTVEFKMHNWRRAITQARDHLLGADYAYICMPRRKITDLLKGELERVGVGLVFYSEDDDWPFEEAIAAPKSKDTWAVARSMLVEHVQREGMR